ncbi:MAG: UDP-N-acetylglucosamine 1-carboxyvinyltransferase [Fusicatenibacter sp.]|nr:UDP-N-acetylglucosamine 1-carboxyvinyltransferase [Fusicatenibacter sp.]
MGVYHILGGRPLHGRITVQKSKNAVLPMIAAALLCEETVVLKGCPHISDVCDMVEILKMLGAKVLWEGSDLYLECKTVENDTVEGALAEKMRSSVLFLGSLLGRKGRAVVHAPGGCTIGKRPTDLHQMALARLGAHVEEKNCEIIAEAKRLTGTLIVFPKVSVGATENAVLCGVLAEGVTVLENCAREPEIWHLCQLLNNMGAKIEGAGTSRIVIRGVGRLHGCTFLVPPDRIAAGTYLMAGAITRGTVILEEAPVEEMGAVLGVYEKMGGQYAIIGGTLVTDSQNVHLAVPYLETSGYPGFPTDLQSLYLAVAVTLEGSSRIRETIFEDRMKTAGELRKMGAKLKIEDQEICTENSRLLGADVTSTDLRGGAALVIAALGAKGITTIRRIHLMERGYERFPENLSALGAKILVENEALV